MTKVAQFNKWFRIIAYLLGIGTLGTTPAILYEYGDQIWETEEPQLSLQPQEEEAEPPVDSLDADAWDDIFRTSDMEKEKPTQASKRYNPKRPRDYKPKPAPKGAHRVGCECMDEVRQEKTGRGACGGHGGVRYWIYQLEDESLMRHPTWRHEDHPSPLSEAELQQLDAYRPAQRSEPSAYDPPNLEEMEVLPADEVKVEETDQIKPRLVQEEKRADREDKGWGFYDIIVMLMVCITIAFITHTMFARR